VPNDARLNAGGLFTTGSIIPDFTRRDGDFWSASPPKPPARSAAEVVAFVQAVAPLKILFKNPGVAKTMRLGKMLLALDVINLKPRNHRPTRSALILNTKMHIAKLQVSERNGFLDQAKASLDGHPKFEPPPLPSN